MNKLNLIIQREFLAKVRNKTFIIMTFLSPLLIIGFTALIVFLGKINTDTAKIIAYIDESLLFNPKDFESNSEIIFIDYSKFSLEEAKIELQKNHDFGLLYIPKNDSLYQIAQKIQFISNDPPNSNIINKIETIIENRLRIIRLNEMGIAPEQLELSEFKADLKLSNFTGEIRSKFINEMKAVVGSIAGYFIMLFIIIYGTMVMRSVIEEKTSRIIEVIISSVNPFQLMMGKVLGTALAGILQFLIWIIVISGILFFLINFFDVNLVAERADQIASMTESSNKIQLVISEFLSLPLWAILWLYLFYFLGGFLLYSALYAAIGAAVDNETDTQQFMMPVVMPLILGIYVGFATVLTDPHGPVSVLFSYIPFTSPIVMLMRIPFGVPWWEIAISMGILIISFIFMIWVASKIYRIGILMYGKKPSYKDLYKWLKY